MNLYSRLFLRIKVEGTGNIPRKGGVLMASNHLSYWDPPVVAANSGRLVRFMAKESLFEKPFFGWYIAKLGAFPVKREASDSWAYKMSLKILKEGGKLLVFPEGTRGDWKKLGEAKPGIARIAFAGGVPVVPVLVSYEKKLELFGLNRVSLRFGKPISYDEKMGKKKEYLQEFSEKIMSSMKELDYEGRFKN